MSQCAQLFEILVCFRDSIVWGPVTTNPVDLNILEHILKPSNCIFVVFCIKHLCAFWFQDGATITELLLPGSLLTTFAASLRAKTKRCTVNRLKLTTSRSVFYLCSFQWGQTVKFDDYIAHLRSAWIQFERSILLLDNGTDLQIFHLWFKFWSLGRSLVVHNALLGVGPLPRGSCRDRKASITTVLALRKAHGIVEISDSPFIDN